MQKPANLLKDSQLPLVFPTTGAQINAPKPILGTSLRTSVKSLTVMQKEALVASTRHDKIWRLASDEGAYLGGHDYAPPPLAFLGVGMLASYFKEIDALAAKRGFNTKGMRLVQDNFYSMKGSMQKGTMIASAEDVQLEVQLNEEPSQDLNAFILDAVAASPLNGLMAAPIESKFTLNHNGTEQELGSALPVDGPTLADPGDVFKEMKPLSGDWSDIVYGTGEAAPRRDLTTTFAGGALTDVQDRMLHVRVVGHRRDDGLLAIELHLFNPVGTMFFFLCDDAGLCAPDAETYICAGIGFCFMTQFGRYAKMGKYDLQSYGIVQDAHFSLAGASDGTGQAGRALPLETHVHLHTGEDDDFAKTALDVAERTCFLHSFCQTALKVRLKVSKRQ